MGWQNPERPWNEMERILSGRGTPSDSPTGQASAERAAAAKAAAEKAAAEKAAAEKAAAQEAANSAEDHHAPDRIPYAELHTHSHYSFLDGASSPEALVNEAVRLGLDGIALTDHDGFPGAPRFAEAATEHRNLATVYGSELSLGLDVPQLGVADPAGTDDGPAPDVPAAPTAAPATAPASTGARAFLPVD